jgi:hypothetical protein
VQLRPGNMPPVLALTRTDKKSSNAFYAKT